MPGTSRDGVEETETALLKTALLQKARSDASAPARAVRRQRREKDERNTKNHHQNIAAYFENGR
ncbi:hypothetical protein [Acidocella sp.]|uniref:hypothetical protein n=1 Tax=Acidocella sp. TaxID=50710 RepID=UPI0026023C52|nr:hypothetical protein [Acidocella sp.]